MNRATPEQIHKSMQAVQILLDAGIAFVPIPVMSEQHREEMIGYGGELLEQMAKDAEKEESNG